MSGDVFLPYHRQNPMKKEVSIVLSQERKNYRKLAQDWYGLTNEQMRDMDVHHNPPRHEGGRDIPEHLFVYHRTLHAAIHGNDFTKWARKGGKLGAKAQPRATRVENGRKNGKKNIAALLERDPEHSRRAALKAHEKKNEEGKSVLAVRAGEIGGQVAVQKQLGFLGAPLQDRLEWSSSGGSRCREEGLGIFASISEEEMFNRCSKGGKVGSQITHSIKDEKGRSVVAMKAAAATHSCKWEDPDNPELGQKPPGILVMMQKRRGLPHGKENRKRVQ